MDELQANDARRKWVLLGPPPAQALPKPSWRHVRVAIPEMRNDAGRVVDDVAVTEPRPEHEGLEAAANRLGDSLLTGGEEHGTDIRRCPSLQPELAAGRVYLLLTGRNETEQGAG